MSEETYKTQDALVLACAAHRQNGEYLKEDVPVLTADNKVMYTRFSNKNLVVFNLRAPDVPEHAIAPLAMRVIDSDREMAEDIRKFFRRLVFAAVKNEEDFWTQVNAILINDQVPKNRIGYVACLPSMYLKEYAKNKFERIIKDLAAEHLGEVCDELLDRDCEIIDVRRSKNYDAWNICAIIDNKMASWMSKDALNPGPCVLIKGKVKDTSFHWKYQCHETRLNYVKAFQ